MNKKILDIIIRTLIVLAVAGLSAVVIFYLFKLLYPLLLPLFSSLSLIRLLTFWRKKHDFQGYSLC